MKGRYLVIILVIGSFVAACNDDPDYRDTYVGDYVGNGYSGRLVVEGTGISKVISPESGVIHVAKDKSSVHILKITIDENTYSARFESGLLSIDPIPFDWEDASYPGYTFETYQSASGSITEQYIKLNFQYSGTATYTPSENPSDVAYYDIGGTGTCSGTK